MSSNRKRPRRCNSNPMDSTDSDISPDSDALISDSSPTSSSPARKRAENGRFVSPTQRFRALKPPIPRKPPTPLFSATASHRQVASSSVAQDPDPVSLQQRKAPTASNMIELGTPIRLYFIDNAKFGLYYPTMPLVGSPIAIDHSEKKIYLLTSHDGEHGEDTGPGSTLHCLDLKTMRWDDTVHDIQSANQFDTKRYLPICLWTTLHFYRHENGGKFLFIFGGHFGPPDRKSGLNEKYMTILVVNLSTKTWDVLHTVGAAPKRCGHDAVNIGNRFYIFGGRSNIPDGRTNDWRCSPDKVLNSYSILEWDNESRRWVWSVEDKPYPPHVKPLGYLLSATPVVLRKTTKILLTPGMQADTELLCEINPNKYALYDPSRDTFMTWNEDYLPSESLSLIGAHEICPFPSSIYDQGYSDTVVIAHLLSKPDIDHQEIESIEFLSYAPPYNVSFRSLGTIKADITKRRKDGPDGPVRSGKERSFAGFITVGNSMYILAKDVEEDHFLDTIIPVKFKVDMH